MPTATIPLQLNLQILGRITVSYIYHTLLFIDEQDLATGAAAIEEATMRSKV
ncbi:hypothetical protein [Nostoc sp. S13]|uniref:hypothetical protein n=1 Tax=Nostoc sp. S13 TaxID=3019266 RepID=UPI002627056E|nr:hypothetical protein [Nostoc sp. S13]MDF5736720.1 hypothetical protein [Nostoc sp. S13]